MSLTTPLLDEDASAVTPENAVIVTNTQELHEAHAQLSSGDGGTILLRSGAPYSLRLVDPKNKSVDAPVTIRSETPEDPVELRFLNAQGRENLTIENVHFYAERDDLNTYQKMVQIGNSETITIRNSSFASNAEGAVGTDGDVVKGADLMTIRGSDGVVFENNTATGFNHGITLMDTYDTTVTGNAFTAFQGDGIRLAGASGATIAQNHLHDFLGSTQAANHGDMIQLWGTRIKVNNENISIRENFLDTGNGAAYQMIFGGNNQLSENGFLFENVTIENNVIFGAHKNMIRVGDTKNSSILNNTVLYNPDSYAIEADGTRAAPHMTGTVSMGGENPIVEGNIAQQVVNGGLNTELSLTGAGNYRDHFANIEAGGSGDLSDLTLLPDSPLNGVMGSFLTWNDGTAPELRAIANVTQAADDVSVFTLDATPSQTPLGFAADTGAAFRWEFSDGTVKTGAIVEHDFGSEGRHEYALTVTAADGSESTISRRLDVAPATFLDARVEDGSIVNAAATDLSLFASDAVTTQDDWILIGGDGKLNVSRNADYLFDSTGFSYGLTARIEAGAAGTLLYLHKTLAVTIDAAGLVHFNLTTDAGDFEATTTQAVFAGGATHHLDFVYDNDAGRIDIYVDGEAAASAEAHGTTAGMLHWGLTVGHTWSGGIDAGVKNLRLSQEPQNAESILQDYRLMTDPDSVTEKPFFTLTDAEGETQEMPLLFLDDAGESEQGVLISETDIVIPREHGIVFDSGGFEISFDMAAVQADTSGSVLYLHDTLSLEMMASGRLAFGLTTDDGFQRIATGDQDYRDMAGHSVTVGYDSSQSEMYISVDGEIVSTGEQTGETAPVQFWALTFGETLIGTAAEVFVDTINLSEAPATPSELLTQEDASPSSDALIFLDFENDSIADQGRAAAPMSYHNGEMDFVTDADGSGRAISIDKGEEIMVSRTLDAMYEREGFVFNLDLLRHANSGEKVFGIHKSFDMMIKDNDLSFSLETSDGVFEVNSQDDAIADDQWHNVEILYNSAVETLQLSLDGAVVDEVTATGTTQPRVHWGLGIGSTWGNGFDGEIDNFGLSNPNMDDLLIA